MNLLSVTMAVCAALVAYWRGHSAGVAAERERVNHGLDIARSYVSSTALDLLAGWIWKDIDEERLRQGMREYGDAKKAKHEAEQRELLERLTRRGEKP
jgi:hypothetical protein